MRSRRKWPWVWLRGQIAPGLEQARRGHLVDATLEEILDDIDRRLDTEGERVP